MKHALKMRLRRAYAALLWRTRLFRLVSRLAPARLVVLAGHCVEDPESNGHLPRDMIVRPETLRRWLGVLGRHFELCTVSGGLGRLAEGPARGRGLVALSMDDGYRDNRRVLLPLLAELKAPATVYLETRVLDERRVNWSHKYFWLVRDGDVEGVARAYAARTADGAVRPALEEALAAGERLGYRVKRILKYDADPADREGVIDAIFRERGGDERELCEGLFLDWDGARELAAAGVELGAHTVSHPVLSRIGDDDVVREVRGAAESMERALEARPRTFAYPFGRRWDFDDRSAAAAREAGFEAALTSHAGANVRGSDPLRLKRVCIDDRSELPLLVAEACGGFELLRRLGIDLSE